MRTDLTLATVSILLFAVLAIAGGATAQDTYAPTPSANDLGWSENYVLEEPDQPDDDNGFEDGFFSPKDDRLVLDGFTEYRVGNPFVLFVYDEDLNAIRNNVVHGDDTAQHEEYMFPGQVNFEAWWGYWSDTGGFGDFQQNPHTDAALGENTAPNGAIDDANDCDNPEWDEFVWRGANSCAADAGIPEADTSSNMDVMFAFVQPGTHDMHVNTMVVGCACPDDAVLRDSRDHKFQPDWIMENPGGQVWRQANGFTRYQYDSSLLVSTQVTLSVNPEAKNPANFDASGPLFDPLQGAGDATHAHDVDIYTSPDPVVEDAYRTTIWDPSQDYGDNEDEQNIFAGTLSGSDADERGLKGIAKYPVHQAWLDTQDTAFTAVSEAVEPTEPATGVADDAVFGPYFHEPNTADDNYQYANLDSDATSYGSLDGYYQPVGEDYTGYQEAEHFWIDGRVGVNTFPIWVPGCCIGYGGFAHLTPEIPSTSNPVDSTTSEDDDNTFGPGALYWHGNAGTWYDANEDTWVGNPTGDTNESTDDPYNNGNTDDPNQYASDEFRGSCSVNWNVKLVPTEDSDGDGTPDWGTTGVYYVPWSDANPYTKVVTDALGDTAQPVGDALRDNPNIGGTAAYVVNDDENGQFSRHRTEGPIEMGHYSCSSVDFGSGDWESYATVIFPAGNLDVGFEVVSEAELTDKTRLSQHGTNKNDPLKGESVTDIDEYVGILSTNE